MLLIYQAQGSSLQLPTKKKKKKKTDKMAKKQLHCHRKYPPFAKCCPHTRHRGSRLQCTVGGRCTDMVLKAVVSYQSGTVDHQHAPICLLGSFHQLPIMTWELLVPILRLEILEGSDPSRGSKQDSVKRCLWRSCLARNQHFAASCLFGEKASGG